MYGKKITTWAMCAGACITLSFFVTNYSCKKVTTIKNTDGQKTTLVQEARQRLSQLSPASNEIQEKRKNYSSRVTDTRLSSVIKSAAWENASLVQQVQTTYLVVPTNESFESFKKKNYDFFRDIIFYKDPAGTLQSVFFEVLGTKACDLSSVRSSLPSLAFLNHINNTRVPSLQGVNATVAFYDQDYKKIATYELSNGNWNVAKYRFDFRSDLEISNN